MVRSELIDAIQLKTGVTKEEAEQVLDIMFDGMSKELSTGGRVEIRGFGSFAIKKYKQYSGRNPQNGTPVMVAPKNGVVFKTGKELEDRILASGKK